MGRRPQPVFPRVTTDDAPRLAAELFVEYIFGIPGEETLDLNEGPRQQRPCGRGYSYRLRRERQARHRLVAAGTGGARL